MAFTNAGKQEILDWLTGGSVTIPSHIGVGEGTTGFDITQTGLVTELFPDATDRNSIVDTSRTGRQATFDIVIGAAELTTDPTITETGIFNAATAGDMFTRNVFNGVAKDGDTEVQIIEIVRVI